MRAICFIPVFAIAAWSVAQTPPGQFDRPSRFVAQNVRSEEMGRCAVRFDRTRAIAIVLSKAGEPDEKAATAKFMPALTKCLNGTRSATLDPSYLRGGIAEALLTENGQALLATFAQTPPATPSRVSLADAKEPVVTLLSCAAAAQPGDAAAVIASPAASPAEAAAFGRLTPSLQACAPAVGEVHIDPARVRPATAIALYRLVAAR